MADAAQSELHELDEQRSAIERLVQFEPKGNHRATRWWGGKATGNRNRGRPN